MKMEKILTTALLTLCITMGNVIGAFAAPSDIQRDHWAYSTINYALDSGLMTIKSNGQFKPNGFIDKFETSRSLAKASGYSPSNTKINNDNYTKYKTMFEQLDNRYETWDNSANMEIASLLSDGIYKPEDLNLFIVKFSDGTEKHRLLSVEEVSVYFTRLIEREGEAQIKKDFGYKFNDDDKINPNMRSYVYILAETRYIIPDSGNNIIPKDAITRAWFATLLYEVQTRSIYSYKREDILTQGSTETGEYIYSDKKPYTFTSDDQMLLRNITDENTAIQAIKIFCSKFNKEEKKDSFMLEVMAKFSEEAISGALTKQLETNDITINQNDVDNLGANGNKTRDKVQQELSNLGVNLNRSLRSKIVFETLEKGTVHSTFNITDIPTDLMEIRTGDIYYIIDKDAIKSQNGSFYVYATKEGVGYYVDLSLYNIKERIIVGMDDLDSKIDAASLTIFDGENSPVASKYNYLTEKIEGRIFQKGYYFVKENKKTFKDITDKPNEVQNAINTLASRGIIYGKSADSFFSNEPLTRADFATMVLRATGKYEKGLKPSFKDVNFIDYYYETAGSSEKYGILTGYEDGTFRGNVTITKEQMTGALMRTLFDEKPFKVGDGKSYAEDFTDSEQISGWALQQVGVLTKYEIVVPRTDGRFSPKETMTREEAAVMIMRFYELMW